MNNKIKSEKAIFKMKGAIYHSSLSNILKCTEEAIIIAEQEAEEKAIEAANMLYEDLNPIFIHPMKREWVIDKFKEFYNNITKE